MSSPRLSPSSASHRGHPPHAHPPVAADTRSHPTAAQAGFANVLIVDRNRASRHALAAWFGEHGYFVAEAEDHETALATLRTIRFDLLVCDSSATSHAGRRWIERLFLRPPCPIVFIAAHPTLETAIRIANLPIAGYLLKPVDLVALQRVVGRFLCQTAHLPPLQGTPPLHPNSP